MRALLELDNAELQTAVFEVRFSSSSNERCCRARGRQYLFVPPRGASLARFMLHRLIMRSRPMIRYGRPFCTASAAGAVQARNANSRWDPQQMASTRLPEHWDAIVAQHALCVLRLQTGRREEAYSALASVVQPFLKVTMKGLIARHTNCQHTNDRHISIVMMGRLSGGVQRMSPIRTCTREEANSVQGDWLSANGVSRSCVKEQVKSAMLTTLVPCRHSGRTAAAGPWSRSRAWCAACGPPHNRQTR